MPGNSLYWWEQKRDTMYHITLTDANLYRGKREKFWAELKKDMCTIKGGAPAGQVKVTSCEIPIYIFTYSLCLPHTAAEAELSLDYFHISYAHKSLRSILHWHLCLDGSSTMMALWPAEIKNLTN